MTDILIAAFLAFVTGTAATLYHYHRHSRNIGGAVTGIIAGGIAFAVALIAL